MHSFRHSLANNVSNTPGVNIENACDIPMLLSGFAHFHPNNLWIRVILHILHHSAPITAHCYHWLSVFDGFFDRGSLRLIWVADWSVPPSFPPQIALWWESCPQWIRYFPWRRQINHPGFTVLLVKNCIPILNCNDPSLTFHYSSIDFNNFVEPQWPNLTKPWSNG